MVIPNLKLCNTVIILFECLSAVKPKQLYLNLCKRSQTLFDNDPQLIPNCLNCQSEIKFNSYYAHSMVFEYYSMIFRLTAMQVDDGKAFFKYNLYLMPFNYSNNCALIKM